MRRSNAPSFLSSASKRTKFVPPVRNDGTENSLTLKGLDVAHKFGLSFNGSPVALEKDGNTSGECATENIDNKENLKDTQEEEPILRQCSPKIAFKSPLAGSRLGKPSSSVLHDSDDDFDDSSLGHTRLHEAPPQTSTTLDSQPFSLISDESQKKPVPLVVTSSVSAKISTTFKTKKFSAPSKFLSPSSSTNAVKSKSNPSSDEATIVNEIYYSVVWGKASTKKHKKWEGDGVLIVAGKSVILKDMEAKQIGKGSGYKSTEIHNMCDGSTLMVGGKEIEVQGRITKEDYATGKCFFGGGDSSACPVPCAPAPKPFISHHSGSTLSKLQTPLTPRHDPNKPGALVMPRPTMSCPSKTTGRNQIVDVVVDPFLSHHLRPHQREGVTFLYECVMGMRQTTCGAILADEMGLGKTLQCISLVWTLLKQCPYGGSPVVRKAVVITPGSLVKNWCHEFTKWLGSERLIPFAVSGDNRVNEFLLQNKSPVMVISYEMFLRCIEDVRKAKFHLVICDEAHRLKNAKIKTGTALGSLGISKIVLLTGTPIQNNLEEFYTLAEVANPGILGSLSVFKKVFVEPITRSQQPDCEADDKELGTTRAAELTRIMATFVLRRTAEINKRYLPPKVEHVVFIKMTDLQMNIYQELLKTSAVRGCLSYSYKGSAHLKCINALKKLCNDPLLIHRMCTDTTNCNNDDEETLVSTRLLELFPTDYPSSNLSVYSAKLSVLNNMLVSFLSTNHKCVVVSNSTKSLDILQDFLVASSYTFVRLDGQTAMSERQSIVDHFNDKRSNKNIFLLSSKAGGVGLNLTGASKLILYDIDWNPANDLQSMARVWRDGQKHAEVQIYRFVITGSIEEKMYQRQVSKQALSGTVVDFTDSDMVEFSHSDLRDLFTLKETQTCTTHDMLQCNCNEHSEQENTLSITSSSSVRSKNVSMAELMEWDHVSNLESCENLDEGLRRCDNVTFLFRSK